MVLAIGNVALSDPVILAPMSGITDFPYRRLVRKWGVGLVVSEMIASEAMIRANRKTLGMSTIGQDEKPVSVQLVGNNPEVMADAARINMQRGAHLIDINMGCPVKKIIKGNAGAALMRDELLAGRIMDAVVKAVTIPVTLKMRTGWDETSRNAPRLARIAEDAGIQAITVHGRTRTQLYKGHADWAFIGEVKSRVSIPIIGNGDVNDIDDAKELLKQSGADGIMIGRGTYGRPWFPKQVAHFLKTREKLPSPPLDVRFTTLLEHFNATVQHYGENIGVHMARKYIAWYSKGLRGSMEFRATINRISDAAKIVDTIRRFYEPLIEHMAI